MADDRPTKPFNLNADPERLRDKDNADPRHEPKLTEKTPAPNLAPGGAAGIRRGLPVPEKDKAKPFTLGRKGDLSHAFKPIAKPRPDRNPSQER